MHTFLFCWGGVIYLISTGGTKWVQMEAHSVLSWGTLSLMGGLTGVRMSLELKGWYRYPNKSYDGAKTEIPAGQTKERVRQPWCSGLHQEKLCESKALEGEKAERLLKVTEEGGDRWWEQRTEAETKGHQMLEIAELWKQLRFGFKHWSCSVTLLIQKTWFCC